MGGCFEAMTTQLNAFGFEVEVPPKPCEHIEALRKHMQGEQLCIDIEWNYNSVGISCKRCAITVSCCQDSDVFVNNESKWP
jgi:hypothetical protein